MVGLIYKITCRANNKVYIGITSQKISIRWSQHKSSAKNGNPSQLSRTIRKYGYDNFEIEPIACCLDYSDLLTTEKIVIQQYDSYKNGMNDTLGGEGVLGNKHTKNTKLLLSDMKKQLGKDSIYLETISKSAKIGWTKRTQEQIDAHRLQAAINIKHAIAARKTTTKPKIAKEWKGKGYNMKIKTHCPAGHEYNKENTFYRTRKTGTINRICKICHRANSNLARDRQRVK